MVERLWLAVGLALDERLILMISAFLADLYSSRVIASPRGRMPLMMYLLSNPRRVLTLIVCASAVLNRVVMVLMNSRACKSGFSWSSFSWDS